MTPLVFSNYIIFVYLNCSSELALDKNGNRKIKSLIRGSNKEHNPERVYSELGGIRNWSRCEL